MPDLFPTVDVTTEKRALAVWGVCRRFGYGKDENGEDIPGAWEDNAAMWTFYRAKLIKTLKIFYGNAKRAEAESALPDPDAYAGDLD